MMNPEHIWLLAGYAGSGKDTSGSILQSLLNSSHVHLSAFAASVKDEVAELYSLPRTSLDTQVGKQAWIETADGSQIQVRSLLIQHGQGKKQETGNPYIWAERVHPPSETKHWILTDWRFIGELECLKRRFPTAAIHTLRILKSDIKPLTSETEHELDQYMCNFIVDNSGSILYLANQLQTILESILIGNAFLQE